MSRTAWKTRAACRGKPTAWFFPPDRGRHPPSQSWSPPREALECSAACPVQAECEKAGEHEYGLWGGVFHRERGDRRIHPARAPEPERVDLSRIRARRHICDGCGRGFLSMQGMRSHQAHKRCGRAYPPLTRAQEVAVFEQAMVDLEAECEAW